MAFEFTKRSLKAKINLVWILTFVFKNDIWKIANKFAALLRVCVERADLLSKIGGNIAKDF